MLVGLIAAVIAGGLSQDDPRPLRVEVLDETDAMCMTTGALRELVGETLEQPFLEPGAGEDGSAGIRVHTRFESGDRETRIEVSGASGTARVRSITIEDERCEELLGAVALVSALLLDEIWQEERTLVVPPAPKPQPPVSEAAPRGPPPSPPWRVFVAVGGELTYQDLPGLAGGATLRTEFVAPRVVGFGVAAHVWPRKEADAEGEAAARFSAYDASLFVCPRFVDAGRFMLGACAAGRVGVLNAVGRGLTSSGGATRPRAFADVGLAGRVHVGGPMWLSFGVGAAAVLVRDRFVYDEGAQRKTLHRSWPVVPTARLALEIRSIVKGRRGAQ